VYCNYVEAAFVTERHITAVVRISDFSSTSWHFHKHWR